MERKFGLQRKISWKLIYIQKITNILDKNVAKFNYKLLHNLLSNRYLVSIDNKCILCNDEIENNMHLIYDCRNAQQIWKSFSTCLKFDIDWKHIIIGFYDEINDKTILLNNLISYIACRIYKFKKCCRIKGDNESSQNITSHIKTALSNLL